MIRNLREEDLASVAALWAATVPYKYHVDDSLLWQNSFGNLLYSPSASFAFENESGIVGAIVIKNSAHELFDGPDPDSMHINCLVFSEFASGAELLSRTIEICKKQGAKKLIFGQDSGHFFPGVPEDMHELRKLLEFARFKNDADFYDVQRDISDYMCPTGVWEKVNRASFHTLDEANMRFLKEFFEREFPRRWMYDVLRQIEAEHRYDIVTMLMIDGFCEGFAFIQDMNCTHPIGGGVWRKSLGDRWCSLGPVGVSERLRGQGFGDGMLAFGLETLQSRGCRNCIIDWTTLKEFYGKHGFSVRRTYTPFALQLA